MFKKIHYYAALAILSPCITQCPAGVKPNKPKIVSDNSFIGFFKGISDPYVAMKLLATPDRFFEDEFITYYTQTTPYVETLSQIDVSSIDLKNLPSPYNQLTSLKNYNADGFYLNAKWIENIFKHNVISNAVEVGSHLGLSARHIASLLPSTGKLYAVDVWDNTTSEGYIDNRFEPFLSNIIHTGLYNIIIPIKDRSENAINFFISNTLKFDFIYIDGDHETEAVMQDITIFYPLLTSHGIIAGDDWLLKSVRAGVIAFAQEHNLIVYATGNFWFLKKENSFEIKELYDAPYQVWKF